MKTVYFYGICYSFTILPNTIFWKHFYILYPLNEKSVKRNLNSRILLTVLQLNYTVIKIFFCEPLRNPWHFPSSGINKTSITSDMSSQVFLVVAFRDETLTVDITEVRVLACVVLSMQFQAPLGSECLATFVTLVKRTISSHSRSIILNVFAICWMFNWIASPGHLLCFVKIILEHQSHTSHIMPKCN